MVEVNDQNAQAVYPPDSCVFVAKYNCSIEFTSSSANPCSLVQMKSDEELERCVKDAFKQFGTVYVKIKRDHKHMPYAFCQFTVSTILIRPG